MAQGTTNAVLTEALRELRWLLLQSCQCNLPYDFTAPTGYFTCPPITSSSDYIIFRARLSSASIYSAVNLASLKANFTSYITGKERNVLMTINGGGYLVSPGPCGLTIPHFNSPHCFNDTLDSEVAPMQPVASTPPQDNTTATSITDSTQPVVIQDNTTVIVIVGAMCGATLILQLSGCIFVLLLFMRRKKM